MYISEIAHLRKTQLAIKTSAFTPSSLCTHFTHPTPSPHSTIPITTHPKLQHPTTHPLLLPFLLTHTIPPIPHLPSLFPPIREGIATTTAVSSNTPIALLAPTPSLTHIHHAHRLLRTLLCLSAPRMEKIMAIASCIACTSTPFTSRQHHHSTPRDAPHINEVHMSRFGEVWSESE
mgnify:CR=1 FL=1